jgi:two-component system, NarL family, sensor histidine kinase DesK
MIQMRKLRLLPEHSPLGWTPYAWLFYLPTFLIEPVIRTRLGLAGPLYWTATVIGLVIFLVSYFRGFWVRGDRLLGIIALQTALAVAFTPINTGAGVLYVYAASFAGYVGRPRLALRLIAGIAVIAALMGLLTQPPLYYWVVSIGITLLVGGVNLHFAETGVAQRKLRLAHDEIEHLAAVAERERIARDLHDVLGHTLSLIVLKAELAVRLADQAELQRAAIEMRDVEQVARRTLREVREAIRGYRATLGEEIDRARALLKAAGIEHQIDVASVALDVTTEETLALVLREAVTNVVRHARASHFRAGLRIDERGVVLDVEDDGRGPGAPEGSGLRGMRERVEAHGGSVERPPGAGMRLRVVMPLAAAHAAAGAGAEPLVRASGSDC